MQLDRDESGFFYGYVVVIAAFFVMLVSNMGFGIFGLFLKPLINEFGWTTAMASGAYSLCMVIYGILSIVMGGLNDRFGPRVLATICGILLGAGFILMSRLNTLWQLYLLLGLLISTGMSGLWIPQLSSISRWFVKRRSLMTGIVVAGVGIGGLIEPPIISRLIEAYGWRSSSFIVGITILVIMIIAAQFMRRDPAQMGLSPYGEDAGDQQGSNFQNNDFSFKEAVITIQFWLALFILICFGYSVMGIMVHIVRHAIELEVSAIMAANILALNGGISIIGCYLLGALGDRYGNKQTFIIGFILTAAALLGLALFKGTGLIFFFTAISGLAFGGMGAVESPLVAWLFGLTSHGLIYGVIHIGFTIGAAVGPVVMGYIFDVTGSYQLAFIVGSVVSIIGLILAAALRPPKF